MSSSHSRHLADIILGGQDGLVNVLGLSIGVVGATADPKLVVVSGLAALFAESISMGAVAYTSSKAEADLEATAANDAGINSAQVERIVSGAKYLDEGQKRFVRTRLLGASAPSPERSRPLSKAVKVWLATMAGSFVPLWPYFLFEVHVAAVLSILSAAFVLFSTGALKAHWTYGSWKRSGFEMLLVGGLATLAGYGIGLLLRAPVA
ncbi:VIT family protein [uncultured archaeon]|nr:VIT family protein [uncultured archaeon]